MPSGLAMLKAAVAAKPALISNMPVISRDMGSALPLVDTARPACS